MINTLNIDNSLIQSIKRYSGDLNETEIINQALEEYLARLKRDKLKNAFGRILIDLDVREYRNRGGRTTEVKA